MPSHNETYGSESGIPAWWNEGFNSQDEADAWYASHSAEEGQRRRNEGSQRSRSLSRGGQNPDRVAYDELIGRAPSVDDLSVDYGEEADIAGPAESARAGARADEFSIAAQRRALSDLQDIYAQGGITAADRSRMALAQQEVGRSARATREADMASLQARGMGGSGSQLASMMGSQQYGADALASRDAQIQVAAQQRALQALQASGQLSGQMRGQSFDEEDTRRSAIDDFNRWQTDYQRGREGRNTERRGRTAESRAAANQTAFTNRMGIAAGRQGQNTSSTQVQQYNQDRTDRWTGAGLSAAGAAVGGITRMG